MWGLLSLLGCGYNIAKEKHQQNKPYYGTDRELFRNNPAVQKKDLGTRRLVEDLNNGVDSDERFRRRCLGYYDGENVDLSKK